VGEPLRRKPKSIQIAFLHLKILNIGAQATSGKKGKTPKAAFGGFKSVNAGDESGT
jgi:hypothetical protein